LTSQAGAKHRADLGTSSSSRKADGHLNHQCPRKGMGRTRGDAVVATQKVNAELKNLGHGGDHIKRVFDTLVGTRPQPMIQTKKSGTTAQARKSFKVTKVGLDRVRGLIAGTAE
jgi:hypothetical protein